MQITSKGSTGDHDSCSKTWAVVKGVTRPSASEISRGIGARSGLGRRRATVRFRGPVLLPSTIIMSTSSDFKHRQQSPGEELELLLPSDPNAELDARLFRRDSNDTEAGYDPVEMRYGYSTPIHIHHRALLLRTFVASTPVLLLALGVGCLFGVLRFAASRYHSSTPLAAPLIPSGYDVESLVSPFPFGATTPSRGDLQSELDRRLLDLNAPLSTLDCPWTTTDRQRYSSLASNGPFFLALNLYNSQQVLPTLARTLLDVATFLEPNNTHISIFENGSTDNTTLILGHLAAAFTGAGISHSILSDPRKTDWKNVDRIAQLSLYRNYALNSLSTPIVGEDGTPRPFQDLVFINDVFTCPRDVKELLWQRREQQADAVCAIDWVTTHSWFGWLGFKSVNFYDNWIARTINGNLLRSRSDLLAEMRDGIRVLFDQPGEEQSRDRFRAGLPVPVCEWLPSLFGPLCGLSQALS